MIPKLIPSLEPFGEDMFIGTVARSQSLATKEAYGATEALLSDRVEEFRLLWSPESAS